MEIINLVNNGWSKIDKDSPGNVFAGPSLREEGFEASVSCRLLPDGLVTRHKAIRLDAVLHAVDGRC